MRLPLPDCGPTSGTDGTAYLPAVPLVSPALTAVLKLCQTERHQSEQNSKAQPVSGLPHCLQIAPLTVSIGVTCASGQTINTLERVQVIERVLYAQNGHTSIVIHVIFPTRKREHLPYPLLKLSQADNLGLGELKIH
jgi:hypothetical protein